MIYNEGKFCKGKENGGIIFGDFRVSRIDINDFAAQNLVLY